MNIAEVVAKMNVYLLNAADVCRKWLEPRLKSLEPNDWWSMIVLPSLSELQQKIVDEIFFRNHERSSDFQAANSMLMDSSDDGSLAFETE